MRCRASDDVGTGISLQSALVTAAPWLVVCPLVARAFATAALDVPLLRARISVLPAAIRAGVNSTWSACATMPERAETASPLPLSGAADAASSAGKRR